VSGRQTRRARGAARLPLWLAAGALCAGRLASAGRAADAPLAVLRADAYAGQIARFNAMEDENVANLIPNAAAWPWLRANIPFFDCPDAGLREIYYFRWWSLRKHLERLPSGDAVFTEFLTRPVPLSSALGHHLMEGRWLRDQADWDSYALYWLRGHGGGVQPDLHKYSQWLAYALYQRSLATGGRAFAAGLLDDLIRDYAQWDAERRRPDGLYWQYDVRDAMEESLSGSRTRKNARPTLNSYMFGNAQAIAAIARWAGRPAVAADFAARAAELKRLVQERLWNPSARFFEAQEEGDGLANVREEIGFIPWYFRLPDRHYDAAWAQFADPAGFRAPFGLTTAERRAPQFRTHGIGECEWDGAVWPFATSQTLTALANVLEYDPAAPVTARDYFEAFLTYARSQHYDGRPYVGEYLDEQDGYWLKGRAERSRYYNHSTFADLLITGLVGLRPREDDTVEVRPLVPPGAWDWFCLDGVPYHGRNLTFLWDRDGRHFGRGAGWRVLSGGRVLAAAPELGPLQGVLPPP
jgi:hypothetical protein